MLTIARLVPAYGASALTPIPSQTPAVRSADYESGPGRQRRVGPVRFELAVEHAGQVW